MDDLPRPWLLAALTGVSALVHPEQDDIEDDRRRPHAATARAERRRRRLVARQHRDRWYGIDDDRPN